LLRLLFLRGDYVLQWEDIVLMHRIGRFEGCGNNWELKEYVCEGCYARMRFLDVEERNEQDTACRTDVGL